jgi:hypothetical protein
MDIHIPPQVVLRGLDPRIHAFFFGSSKAWMAGTSPAKTNFFSRFPLLFGRKIFPGQPGALRGRV